MLALVVVAIALCEYHLIPVEGMLLGVEPGTMYVVEVSVLFCVGIGSFVALKGFNWYLHNKLYAMEEMRREKKYVAMNYIRICLLSLLMMIGVFLYYGTLENWGMYYALASFVSTLFCLPSAEGVKIELTVENK